MRNFKNKAEAEILKRIDISLAAFVNQRGLSVHEKCVHGVSGMTKSLLP